MFPVGWFTARVPTGLMILAAKLPTGPTRYSHTQRTASHAPTRTCTLPSQVWLITTVGVEMDLPLLPHFLQHYTDAGITPDNMVIVLHSKGGGDPRVAKAKEILQAHKVQLVLEWAGVFNTWDKFDIQVSIFLHNPGSNRMRS